MKPKNTTRESRTDWEKLASLPDEKIDTSDMPELDEEFFREAEIRLPASTQLVSLRVDE
jgi:hypothetical protein